MSAFVIRRAQASDIDELRELFGRSVREIASREYRPAQIEAWAAGPLDFGERMKQRITILAEEPGRRIGFIQYDPPHRLDMLYVHPERQRAGIASALLAALEAEAQSRGATFLDVEASITGKPFFAARGFAVITPQIVTVRGQEFLNYRMTKKLYKFTAGPVNESGLR